MDCYKCINNSELEETCSECNHHSAVCHDLEERPLCNKCVTQKIRQGAEYTDFDQIERL